MLILSRRPGESLVLDGGIRIDILSSDGRTVRIGIEAPASVRILRAEIVASVEEETRRAAAAAAQWAVEQRGLNAQPAVRVVTPTPKRGGSRATTAD
jgi:carbon storage regulator